MGTKRLLTRAGMALAVVLAAAALPAFAQEAEPTNMDIKDLPQEWMGGFTLNMDFQGRQVQMILRVSEVEGSVGAVISNDFSGATTVEEIEKTETGLKFSYPATFGGNQLNMVLELSQKDGALEGTMSEKSGLFSAPLTGTVGAAEETTESRASGRRSQATETKLRFGKKKVNVTYSGLPSSGEDYPKLETLKAGEVYGFVGGRASKMFTDLDLVFGDTVIKTENVAKDYPGVYGLWLKKTEDGWHLVFNSEPDIWGTQHNDAADVAEIPATYAKAEKPASTFSYELEQTDTGGVLRATWGDHVWSAPFTVDEAVLAAMHSADKGSVADLAGDWRLEIQSQVGELHYVLSVAPDGTYSMKTDAGEEQPVSDLAVMYDEVTFKSKVKDFDVTFEGTFTADNLAGNFKMGGRSVGEVRGVRETPKAAE